VEVRCEAPDLELLAFDPNEDGVVSAGEVGFDVSCGVRTMLSGFTFADILPVQKELAEPLCRQIPAGVGSMRQPP